MPKTSSNVLISFSDWPVDLKSTTKVGYNTVNDNAIFSKAASCVELLAKQRDKNVEAAIKLEDGVMDILIVLMKKVAR